MSSSPQDKQQQKRSIAALLFLGILPFELNGFYNPPITKSPWLFWAVENLTWVVLPILICMMGMRRKLFTFRDIGFSAEVAGRKNLLLLTASLIVVPLILRSAYLMGISMGKSLFPYNYGAIPFDYANVGPESGHLHVLTALYFALTAGVVEEVYYRGLFRRLFGAGTISLVLYIVLSSLVFASVHWEGGVQRLFLALFYGLVASSLYSMVRNLWPFIIGHFVNDVLWLM